MRKMVVHTQLNYVKKKLTTCTVLTWYHILFSLSSALYNSILFTVFFLTLVLLCFWNVITLTRVENSKVSQWNRNIGWNRMLISKQLKQHMVQCCCCFNRKLTHYVQLIPPFEKQQKNHEKSFHLIQNQTMDFIWGCSNI